MFVPHFHMKFEKKRSVEMLNIDVSKRCCKFSDYPICSPCTLSLPPGNIGKPYCFLVLSGGRERVHWEQMVQLRCLIRKIDKAF